MVTVVLRHWAAAVTNQHQCTALRLLPPYLRVGRLNALGPDLQNILRKILSLS